MKRIVILKTFALGVVCLMLLGCSIFDKSFVIYSMPTPVKNTYLPPDYGDYVVAVAVSGGGSRSAVFAAAVLRELYRQVKLADGSSIVDEIDVMSGVSGGSLASAYWCLNKPKVKSSDTKAYDEFFPAYFADMKKNIEKKVITRPLQFYRFFLKAGEKSYLLRNALDEMYFNGAKFQDLAVREQNHTSPVLIMNGTILDSGCKFIFTNLPRDQFDLGGMIDDTYKDAGIVKAGLPIADDITGTLTCADVGLSIRDMEISRGVAGSAGVPLLVGPVILRAADFLKKGLVAFLHIYDGGIADNIGVETIMDHLLVRMSKPAKHPRGGLVIIIDAGIKLDPSHSTGIYQDLKAAFIANRMLDIYIYREKYFIYRTIMFYQKQVEGMGDIDFVLITPYLSEDKKLIKTFEATPTRFKIEDDQANALDRAAAIAVSKVKDRILADFKENSGGRH